MAESTAEEWKEAKLVIPTSFIIHAFLNLGNSQNQVNHFLKFRKIKNNIYLSQ